MRITIPDRLAEQYQALDPKRPLDEIVTTQLTRFSSVGPRERYLLLRKQHREQVEALLGTSLSTVSDLLDAIRRLQAVTIAGVDVPFTPAQLRAVQSLAAKNRIPVAEQIQKIGREAAEYMLGGV